VIRFTLVGDFYEAGRKREVVHSQSKPKDPVCSQSTINNLQGHDVSAKRNQLFLGAGRLSPGRILSPGGPSCSAHVPPPSHRGDTRMGGRGRLTANTSCDHSGCNGKHPQAEARRDHSGGNIKQAALVHLSSPVISNRNSGRSGCLRHGNCTWTATCPAVMAITK
jgi:hypothetical protein